MQQLRKRPLMITNSQNPDFHLPDRPPRHFSFLLRCMETRTQSQPGSNWCFSLQDPGSETVHNFRNFETMVDFLQSVLDETQTNPKTEKGDGKNAT